MTATVAARPPGTPRPLVAPGTIGIVAAPDRARVSEGPGTVGEGTASVVGFAGGVVLAVAVATTTGATSSALSCSGRLEPSGPVSGPVEPIVSPAPAAPAPAAPAAAPAAAAPAARRRPRFWLAVSGSGSVGGGAAIVAGDPTSASYSPTVAWTGRPAEAAIARAAGSAATIDSTRFRSSASRASSRKLIREVASREPGGRTRATFVSVTARIRAAALVISSSTSR